MHYEVFSALSPHFSGSLTFVLSLMALICLDIIRQNPSDSHSLLSLLEQYMWQRKTNVRGWFVYRKYKPYVTSKGSQDGVQDGVQNGRLPHGLVTFLNAIKNTNFGRKYGCHKVTNIRQFQQTIPLSNYSNVKNKKLMVLENISVTQKKVQKYRQRCLEMEALVQNFITRRTGYNLGRPLVLYRANYDTENFLLQTSEAQYAPLRYN